MFTGIIKEVGIIKSISENNGTKTFVVEAPQTVPGKSLGDSISIDGACHTVTELTDTTFTIQSIPETLKLTTLSDRKPEDRVNLESSLTLQDSLDGHLVTGHIDTTTQLEKITPEGNSHKFTFTLPTSHARFIALKGSIAINGISLTISELTETTFSVSIIPHTIAVTNLSDLKPSQSVNIEIDMLARYTARIIDDYQS